MINRKCSFLLFENNDNTGIFVVLYEVPIEYFDDLQENNSNNNAAVEIIYNDFMNVINENYSLDIQLGISATYVLVNSHTGISRTFFGAFSFSETNIKMLRDFVLYNYTKDEIATAVYESLTFDNINEKMMEGFTNSSWIFSHIVNVTINFQCRLDRKGKNLKFLDECKNKQVITAIN